MGAPIFDFEDVIQKLNGTICRYDGRPVFVIANIAGNADLVCSYLDNMLNKFTIRHDDPKFDYRSAPLGYITVDGNSWYLYRRASRRFQAGLSANNVASVNKYFPIEYITTVHFKECILGEHVSFAEALKQVKDEGKNSVAFNRQFAISHGQKKAITLDYRGEPVAIWVPKLEKFQTLVGVGSSVLERALKRLSLDILV